MKVIIEITRQVGDKTPPLTPLTTVHETVIMTCLGAFELTGVILEIKNGELQSRRNI